MGDFSQVLVIVVLVLCLCGLILVSVARVGVRQVLAGVLALKRVTLRLTYIFGLSGNSLTMKKEMKAPIDTSGVRWWVYDNPKKGSTCIVTFHICLNIGPIILFNSFNYRQKAFGLHQRTAE